MYRIYTAVVIIQRYWPTTHCWLVSINEGVHAQGLDIVEELKYEHCACVF